MVAGGERERLLNGIVHTSLSTNSFTDLRNASMDKPKPRFASSISLSANRFFPFIFTFQKKTGEGTSIWRSKVTLLFSLTCSVDYFMLSPHIWPAFLALIPPSFASLNPLQTFFRPLQPHSSSHNWERYKNSRFNFVAYRKCSHAMKQAVYTKSSRLWMSEENFYKKLSRITFHDYIIYPKL